MALQSSLRLGAGVLDNPIPGLDLLLKYDARDLLGNDPSLVWGTVRYDIVLSAGGAIELEPHETAWHVTGGLGPASSEGSAKIPGWHGALTQSHGLGVEAVSIGIEWCHCDWQPSRLSERHTITARDGARTSPRDTIARSVTHGLTGRINPIPAHLRGNRARCRRVARR